MSTIHAQIESELKWRQDEIRFFQNTFNKNLIKEEELDQSRRALILLLYAHYEGFVKFTLALYVNTVNSEKVICKNANSAIVAATLSHIFQDLRNPDKKHKDFKRDLPDDTQLHRFARDQEFVERTKEFNGVQVLIPDNLVDMESNLKPVVLKKNLYRLGFEYDGIKDVEGDIHKLLSFRNGIAHGSFKDGITKKQYDDLSQATYKVMTFVRELVTRSLKEKKFRK